MLTRVLAVYNAEYENWFREGVLHLDPAEFACTLTSDSQWARQVLGETAFDLLVSDYILPASDIHELAGILRGRSSELAGVLMVSPPRGPAGHPLRFWPDQVDSYVLRTCEPWQLTLAIEQFRWRRITRVPLGPEGE
jgi:DNA-binding response OmpR family regulator